MYSVTLMGLDSLLIAKYCGWCRHIEHLTRSLTSLVWKWLLAALRWCNFPFYIQRVYISICSFQGALFELLNITWAICLIFNQTFEKYFFPNGLKWAFPLHHDFVILETLSFTRMGLSGLEPPTSRLSGVRSNRLSYKPIFQKSPKPLFSFWSGGHLLSHTVSSAVPSAVWVLTVVFGMGTGVSPKRIATRNTFVPFYSTLSFLLCYQGSLHQARHYLAKCST